MFPAYSPISSTSASNMSDGKTLSTQICPIGCICCIMQQFYNRKCWCKEVKESIGIQTDPLPETGTHYGDLSSTRTKTTVTRWTQTDPVPTAEDPTKTVHMDSHVSPNRRMRILSASLGNNKSPKDLSFEAISFPPVSSRRHSFTPDSADDATTPTSPSPPGILAESDTGRHEVTAFPVPRELQDPYVTMVYDNRLAEMDQDMDDADEDIAAGEEPTTYSGWEKSTQESMSMESFFKQGTYANCLLQREITRVTESYDLSGAKDPRFEMAINEVFKHVKGLKHTLTGRKLIRNKIRHKISSRRHYDRMKNEAEKIGVNVSTLKKKRTAENARNSNLIGSVLLASSMAEMAASPTGVHSSDFVSDSVTGDADTDGRSDTSEGGGDAVSGYLDNVVIKKEAPGD